MYRPLMASALAALLGASYLGTAQADKTGGYVETDLAIGGPHVTTTTPQTLTDANGIVHPVNNPKATVDGDLVNPWGISKSATSPMWLSDNGSSLATLYAVPPATPTTASKQGLRVNIPACDINKSTCKSPNGVTNGSPTGTVFNGTTGFVIRGYTPPTLTTPPPRACTPAQAPARFMFATEDGLIVGWAPTLWPTADLCAHAPTGNSQNAIVAVDNSAVDNPPSDGAVYKGLEISTDATHLYATNFRQGTVEKYDNTFTLQSTPDSFVDPKLPKGYAPFNIRLINDKLFVTFAVQDHAKHDDVAGESHGIVDTFDLTGETPHRFAQHGQLNSPWGLALAPKGFGELAETLWIGNFGNGHIDAYDPNSGRFISKVRNTHGQAIVIDGLWTITFGSGAGNGGDANTLYFTAGPNGEADGLFGALSPSP
jgi:uncharacterized protein (TIGR03118 family)